MYREMDYKTTQPPVEKNKRVALLFQSRTYLIIQVYRLALIGIIK